MNVGSGPGRTSDGFWFLRILEFEFFQRPVLALALEEAIECRTYIM
jgi:hypothetical protein